MKAKMHIMILALLAGIGCSKTLPESPKPFPVRGKVILPGGQALSGGVVTLVPLNADNDRRYQGWGFVKSDGTFEVAAFSDPTKGGGVAPGTYKVVIAPREEGEPRGSNARLIPKRYQNETSTPLTIEIKSEENQLQPFVLS